MSLVTFRGSGYSCSSMALLNRVSRIGAMKSVRSWRIAGLILKISFVLLRSIFFIVLVIISVVVWLSWKGGWLLLGGGSAGGIVGEVGASFCCCGSVWLVLCPIVINRSFSAFAMSVGSV